MFSKSGASTAPFLLVHGGAGPQDPTSAGTRNATQKLIEIARLAALALDGECALAAVGEALRAMEDDPQFNAGIGSALQADGGQRLTAALMDGHRQRFSGVISVSHVQNPSLIARHLQGRSTRVVGPPGNELVARELALAPHSLLTAARIERWLNQRSQPQGTALFAEDSDTVGCVAWDRQGKLAGGTSTGGRGNEIPGRVSDSATVAGNYASPFAALSCTGIGEQIVDDALAARIETRCRDGLDLLTASQRSLQEANQLGRAYGWIGIDHKGSWVAFTTTAMMTFAVVDCRGELIASSLDLVQEPHGLR